MSESYLQYQTSFSKQCNASQKAVTYSFQQTLVLAGHGQCWCVLLIKYSSPTGTFLSTTSKAPQVHAIVPILNMHRGETSFSGFH